jgi:hypothetical protein
VTRNVIMHETVYPPTRLDPQASSHDGVYGYPAEHGVAFVQDTASGNGQQEVSRLMICETVHFETLGPDCDMARAVKRPPDLVVASDQRSQCHRKARLRSSGPSPSPTRG